MSHEAPPNIDQRRAVRWRYTLGLALSWGGGSFTAHTSDISTSGAFVETDRELSPGTSLKMQFQVFAGGTAVDVIANGRVARRVTFDNVDAKHPLPGLGVEFQRFISGEEALAGVLEALQLAEQYVDRKGRDQRRAARVPVGLSVLWGTSNPPSSPGTLASVSASGGFVVHSESPVGPGAHIFLQFQLPIGGRPTEIRSVASVVREVDEQGAAGMGITFELSTVDVEIIDHFVRTRQPGGPPRARIPVRPPGPASARPARNAGSPSPGAILGQLRHQTIRPMWIAKVVSLPLLVTLLLLMIL